MPRLGEQSASVAVPAAWQRRPRRSSVRHGQASCADYGCTRAEFRQAALRARRQREQDRGRGLSARVPPHAAARWAVRLREQGMSAQDIADRAGLSVTPVRRVLRTPTQGTTVRDIARTSADAIPGIPLPARRTPGTPGLTDSTRHHGCWPTWHAPDGPPPHSPSAWTSTPARSPRSATHTPASTSTWPCGYAACTTT
ncbi:hypothetical protein ABZ467_34955 [Streptomyces sp. NPDC005727]|uniref:hypothetical protein n=1 Tax=unclassified Streptomyces TaxID=2593676 RepID=UPI0033DDD740